MHWDPERAISVVRELRQKGYKQNVDFDFKYFPPIFDSYAWDEEPKQEKHVVFTFYKDDIATWFVLRYQ